MSVVLLNLVVEHIPVSDIPEFMLMYIPGDECFNYCDTVDQVFKVVYKKDNNTYLDEKCTVLHSFDGKPAKRLIDYSAWYKNGLLHSYNDMPAVDHYYKIWFHRGLIHRGNGQPAIINDTNNVFSFHDKRGRWYIMDRQYMWAEHGKIIKKSDV